MLNTKIYVYYSETDLKLQISKRNKSIIALFLADKMEDNNHWQIGKSVLERNEHMLTNQVMCDVTFIVGQDLSPIKAHKYMLASSSPVFFNMFNGAVAEKGDVRIPDIKADVFSELLQYV